jgi:hypothetical protein
MTTNKEDNGSFASGIVTALMIVSAFFGGYWLRDQGVTIRIEKPANQIERQQE